MAKLCSKCQAEPRQGTHRWGKACLKAYRAKRKGDRAQDSALPSAGDLGVGEQPPAPEPPRERRDPASPGRAAHSQGAAAEETE